MAEQDSSQEKTEQPTPKRLEKAREEGQIPRSKELTTTALLLGTCISFYLFGAPVAEAFLDIFAHSFSFDRRDAFDTNQMEQRLGGSLGKGLLAFIPFFIILLILSIAGPIGLGGWLLSVKSLAPKASRIDPIAGLKRMFSLKALVELGKAIGKVLIILTVAVSLLRVMQGDIIALADAAGHQGVVQAVKIILLAAVILSASTIVIAVIDVPWQIWDTTRQLKMSHQEIKDEMKDSEGKPEVKNKIRQLQRDMATSRMMAAVPDADVVITNPTHYSVAVKYNPADMATPIVVAKGVDHTALKIREIANAHSIELVEAPALARAVYHTTDIDGEIPSGLYLAVAQVLAYIFQLRQFRRGKGRRPHRPRSYPVPEEFYFDQ